VAEPLRLISFNVCQNKKRVVSNGRAIVLIVYTALHTGSLLMHRKPGVGWRKSQTPPQTRRNHRRFALL